nr:MAG TPA: hypothetical protein [Caudoviricetes sp.]
MGGFWRCEGKWFGVDCAPTNRLVGWRDKFP